MNMPKGWKRIAKPQRTMEHASDLCLVDKLELAGIANLMKEMAEALIKVQAVAEMTMPNGTVTPTPLYNDVTPVLKKWKSWK